MYAHDRTLLASLGFADLDKRVDRHDLACRYLTRPGLLEKATGPVFPDVKFFGYEHERMLVKGEGKYQTVIGYIDLVGAFIYSGESWRSEGYPVNTRPRDCPHCDGYGSTVKEKILCSNCEGSGKSKIYYRCEICSSDGKKEIREDCVLCKGKRYHGELLVEVKINRVQVGDVIRQIDMYRRFSMMETALLVTDYTISTGEKEALLTKDILHVKLGPGFDRFCVEQAAEAKTAKNEEV